MLNEEFAKLAERRPKDRNGDHIGQITVYYKSRSWKSPEWDIHYPVGMNKTGTKIRWAWASGQTILDAVLNALAREEKR